MKLATTNLLVLSLLIMMAIISNSLQAAKIYCSDKEAFQDEFSDIDIENNNLETVKQAPQPKVANNKSSMVDIPQTLTERLKRFLSPNSKTVSDIIRPSTNDIDVSVTVCTSDDDQYNQASSSVKDFF